MRLKPKDRVKLRQLGARVAYRPATPGPSDEELNAFEEKVDVVDGKLVIDRQDAHEHGPEGIEKLDLSGGLRITYSVVRADETILRQLAVSRKGGRRVSKRLVISVCEAVGFGGADPSRNPDSGVWHVIGHGPPPGPQHKKKS